jgi:hypothetical protein
VFLRRISPDDGDLLDMATKRGNKIFVLELNVQVCGNIYRCLCSFF